MAPGEEAIPSMDPVLRGQITGGVCLAVLEESPRYQELCAPRAVGPSEALTPAILDPLVRANTPCPLRGTTPPPVHITFSNLSLPL